MSRRVYLTAGAAVLIGGLVVLVVFLAGSPGQPDAAPSAAGPSTPAAVGNQEAHDVAGALQSLATDPRSVMAAATLAELGDRATEGVSAGSAVSPEEESWAPDGAGGGTMLVAVEPPGGPRVTFAAIMVKEDGSWKVLATVPLQDGAAAPATTEQPS